MVSEMRSRRRQVSLKPSQSPQWNKILAVLEMLQIKKGITNVNLLIAPLFDLLKHCLNEDEQAPLEYSKQLILSCLLTCCQKLSPGLSTFNGYATKPSWNSFSKSDLELFRRYCKTCVRVQDWRHCPVHPRVEQPADTPSGSTAIVVGC